MSDIATKVDKYDKLMEDLRAMVKCPVCLAIPEKGPIASCPMGHLVCHPCQQVMKKVKGQLSSCPTCRGPMGKNLNLTAKLLIETMEHPCTNEGCNKVLSHQELSKHKEELCKFREIPSSTCNDQEISQDIEQANVSNSIDFDQISMSTEQEMLQAVDVVMIALQSEMQELEDQIQNHTASLQVLSAENNNLKDRVQVLSSENATLRNHVDPKVLSQMPSPAQASGQSQVQAQGDLGSDDLALGLTPDDQDDPAPQPPQL